MLFGNQLVQYNKPYSEIYLERIDKWMKYSKSLLSPSWYTWFFHPTFKSNQYDRQWVNQLLVHDIPLVIMNKSFHVNAWCIRLSHYGPFFRNNTCYKGDWSYIKSRVPDSDSGSCKLPPPQKKNKKPWV